MHSSFRVLIAEIVCVTLIVTQLSTPVYLWADESHSVSVGASIPLVSESGATSTTSESGQIAIGSSNIGRITPEITSGSDIHFVSNDEILTTHALDRSTSEHIQVGSDIAQDQILISFKPESLDVESTHGKSLVDAVAQSQGMTTAGTISEQNIAIITLPVDSGSTQSSLVPSMEFMTAMEHSIQIDQTISRLKNDPRVSHVQKNFVYKVLDGPRTMKVGAKKFVPMSFSGRSMPNDASFSNLW